MIKMIQFKKAQIAVLFVLFISLVGMPLVGLVVDYGLIEVQRARMQTATDAAALAGAYRLGAGGETAAIDESEEVLGTYGFGTDAGDTVDAEQNPDGMHQNQFRVQLTHTFHPIFSGMMKSTPTDITTSATGQVSSYVELSITLAGEYGEDGPHALLGIRGKTSPYRHGDPYSTIKGLDGGPNPEHRPDGYHFFVHIPKPDLNYKTINGTAIADIQIWDPESYGEFDPGSPIGIEYTLYKPDDTPQDLEDDVQIAQYTEKGYQDRAMNNSWVTLPGFQINLDDPNTPPGRYHLQVRSTKGNATNCFHLRASPPLPLDVVHRSDLTDDEKAAFDELPSGTIIYAPCNHAVRCFNPDNGTAVSADGALPIKFLNDYQASLDIELGWVPPGPDGHQVIHILRFDSDCGAQYVSYWNEDDGENTLYPDGVRIPITKERDQSKWSEDIIRLDDSYTGSKWHANYESGDSDQTAWKMWYESSEDGNGGIAYLVE